MKIFLTGGTGFLGKAVVKRLLKDNHELYILSRKKPTDSIYNNSKITIINGSLENIEVWKSTLSNIEIIIHMAAPVTFWGNWEIYQKGIVEATQNILNVAKEYEIKRLIYISSESVLQSKVDLLNIDESYHYPESTNSYYGKSKQEAEKLLLADDSSLVKIILRPTFIWGKDVPALESFKSKIESKQFMWIDHGKTMIEMVHVDNVAEAISLSCVNGKDKDIFFITDDAAKSVKTFLTDLLDTQSITIPDKSIPSFIAKPLARIIENIWRTLHLRSYPPLTSFDLSFIAMNRKYRINAAKTILGYKPIVTYQEGLKGMKKDEV
ncbi:MAG: NAD(P)-dependent oxidoreductase [Streptococcus sp.]|nr:NAD(P)-dependent oxidoreductase [Streptococcus sp.]